MKLRAPAGEATSYHADDANTQIITDALALQYVAPLPFDLGDADLLTAAAVAWENGRSPVRARRLRIVARGFISAAAGIAPLHFTVCDVADVYQAAMLCPDLERETRRRTWRLADRMHRAITARPVADVVTELLAHRYTITPAGTAALAEPPAPESPAVWPCGHRRCIEHATGGDCGRRDAAWITASDLEG